MENFDFMKRLKEGKVDPLFTQALNGIRIKKHDVIYVFDEVGCGKTVSAIITMASVIDEKENYKILVLTPKSVCIQFAGEIKQKLKLDNEDIIMNLACCNNPEEEIRKINSKNQVIVVSNPHKVKKLDKNVKWDLIIVDEAHDIICNSYNQLKNLCDCDIYDRKEKKCKKVNKVDNEYQNILREYKDRCDNEDLDERRKEHFDKRIKFVEGWEDTYPALAIFVKSIVVQEYNIAFNYYEYGLPSFIMERRDIKNKIFNDICELKTEKVMFLSATPYKYDKSLDFINYALAGTKMTKEKTIICLSNMPDMEWVKKLYTSHNDADNNEDEENDLRIEETNTSLMFKEITQAIPLCGESKVISGKERKVEVWDEKKEKDVLRSKLLGEIRENKNRVIIFVSNSEEGGTIFKRIFPNAGYDIATDNKHEYIDEETNLYCKFVMNKFGNAYWLNYYAKDCEEIRIPDILIVTWQVAQVGVNLPTYNYVINYHIPSVPGYLEQRYGRIDRLNSTQNPLYNIYYLDDRPSTQVYRVNLIQALWNYKNEIMDIPHSLPVKNLLICKELQVESFECDKIYKSLAYYIYSYIKLNEEDNESENKFEIGKYLQRIEKDIDIEAFEVKYENSEIKIKTKEGQEIVYDKENYQRDDETNPNSLEQGENKKINKKYVEESVETLQKCIKEYENLNNMVNQLNGEGIGDAGTIIFWDEKKQKVTVDSKDIVNKLVEIKSCLSDGKQ